MAAVVQILPLSKGGCLLLHGRYISMLKDGQVTLSYTHNAVLTRAAAINDHNVVICDINKTVHLLNHTFSPVATGLLDKSAMCATFDATGRVLVGDKFGDVIRFPLFEESTPWRGEVIAGCVSMLTDLVTTSRYIIMADRDEKIRLINGKDPVVIERFLLEHTEFVACVALLTGEGDRLVSLGGDGRIILWDLEVEEPLQIIKLDPFDPIGITIADKTIAYAVEGDPAVYLIKINPDGSLSEEIEKIPLPEDLRPSTIRFIDSKVVVGGLQGEVPCLAIVADGTCTMIESFKEFVGGLLSNSQSWSQIVRTHLRKSREFDR